MTLYFHQKEYPVLTQEITKECQILIKLAFDIFIISNIRLLRNFFKNLLHEKSPSTRMHYMYGSP